MYEDSKRHISPSKHIPYDERIPKECTFKPKLHERKSKNSLDKSISINGYDKVVNRYRSASKEKQLLNDKIEKSSRGDNYFNTRNKVIEPFKLSEPHTIVNWCINRIYFTS